MLRRLLPIMIAVAALFGACNSNECYENHSALPLADFFSMQDGKAVSVQRLAIYGVGAPGDSILYYDQNLQQAYLPFRLDSDTTRFVLKYMGPADPDVEMTDQWDYLPCDTVTFIYTRKPWFVSAGCGAMYFFDMKDVRHTNVAIDSIATNSVITNENSANIKIYFNTSEE